jgi:hypothetical protein
MQAGVRDAQVEGSLVEWQRLDAGLSDLDPVNAAARRLGVGALGLCAKRGRQIMSEMVSPVGATCRGTRGLRVTRRRPAAATGLTSGDSDRPRRRRSCRSERAIRRQSARAVSDRANAEAIVREIGAEPSGVPMLRDGLSDRWLW